PISPPRTKPLTASMMVMPAWLKSRPERIHSQSVDAMALGLLMKNGENSVPEVSSQLMRRTARIVTRMDQITISVFSCAVRCKDWCQVVPYLSGELRIALVVPELHQVAISRQIDVDDLLHRAGPWCEDDAAVRECNGLINVVRDEDDGLVQA